MKKLRIVTRICVVVTIVAIIAIVFNLVDLYNFRKTLILQEVEDCVIKADILETISRMESGEEATTSFIRLNSIVEMAQHKNGEVGISDTLKISLANLLKIGLEFPDDKLLTNYEMLDSIFIEELHRHNLYPSEAMILPYDSNMRVEGRYWSIECKLSGHLPPSYIAYISPMPGRTLARMWGIIIALIIVLITFVSLSTYLIRSVRRLRTIEQMKDDFTHNMTHELKTPVAVAYSAADSMLRYYDQSDETRNRKFLKIILQKLSFLSGMIENILSMSMERFNTMKLSLERVNFNSLAQDVSEMIKLKTTKPVNIRIEVQEDFSLLADPLHLGNMLSNLLDNAVKYSGDSVNILVKTDSHSIIVKDDGIGISRENLPFIFDKFYRVSSGNLYNVGGYGLGLYYVKQIVEMHGWDIKVSSKLGEGTRFIIKTKNDEERKDIDS